LYVICSPVGPYYTRVGFASISLLANTENVRAWPGGVGCFKVIGNYAPGILPAMKAEANGYDQILWLFGKEHELTEVGTMNLFVLWKSPGGALQLVTPSLQPGMILAGVVRDSILKLTRQWAEFEVIETRLMMSELIEASRQGRLLEVFGTGTAAVITPVNNIHYNGVDYRIPLDPSDISQGAGPLARRLWNALTQIQYGKVAHEWSVVL
jgi:branched-chain amino acid aminotransferase